MEFVCAPYLVTPIVYFNVHTVKQSVVFDSKKPLLALGRESFMLYI
jgi:hypothetical protein